MVVYENYGVNGEGTPITRAYSDAGMYIKRDEIEYSDAIDPTDLNRIYTETDKPIERSDALIDELVAEVKSDD